MMHSPEVEWNVTSFPPARSVKESDTVDDVACCPAKDGPPRPRGCLSAPVHCRATEPGGGDQSAGEARSSKTNVPATAPVTVAVADPSVTEPVIPGDELG